MDLVFTQQTDVDMPYTMERCYTDTVRTLFTTLLLVVTLAGTSRAQAPVVDTVEPPNWWTGMQWNTVQFMLYGDDLHGISARFTDERLQVSAVHTVSHPGYAFVDVHIPPDLPAGTYTLQIGRNGATTNVAIPIEARAPRGPQHAGFDASDVVYLITPDRFANANPDNDRIAGIYDDYDPSQHDKRHGGDLQGITERLDYLHDLGITAIWLNPVLENNITYSYHGYQATNLYRIDPRYGTNAEYRAFVAAAHARGIKIIFDHVSNHIGVAHRWLKALPTATWLNGTEAEHLSDKHYLMSITDPYAAPDTETELRSFWFVDSMPDLNQRDPFLATYLIQNSLWWIEYAGLNGIREDTYPYPDQAFLARWAKAILTEYPDFNIVGEIWNLNPAYIAQFQQESHLPRNFETNLPSVMDFPLSEAIRQYVNGTGKLAKVYEVLAQDFLYTDTSNLFTFFDNHDMARITFTSDNHLPRIKQAFTLLLTTRGIPQLLYASEINMRGGISHVELRADFPGGFPGHTRSAFTEAGRTDEENDLFNHVRSLLHLRKQQPALTRGTLTHYQPTWHDDVYAYIRRHEDDMFLIVLNGHDAERRLTLADKAAALGGRTRLVDAFTNAPVAIGEEGFVLAPYAAHVFRVVE